MPKSVNRLAPRKIASYPPGRHSDGGNLYLAVAPSGSRSWLFMYRFGGKQRELGLGSARDVTLAQARSIATNHRVRLAQGLQPDRKRLSNSRKPTFGEFAAAVIEDLRPGWRNAEHARQWTTTLATHAASLRDVPVDKIDTVAVLAVLKPIWQSTRETADRVRGRIEKILDAARAKGLRSGENPARWRGHLAELLPHKQRLQKAHHAAMPYEALPAFLVQLRARQGVAPLALEFAILTAVRTDEALSATWGEFDLDAGLWTIPATRMKAGREHIVPLSERAIEIVQQLRQAGGAFVFPGQRPGSQLSHGMMLQCLKELAPQFTVHGFRSTFRDWAGDCTATPREIAEAALAHSTGSAVEEAYRRSSALAKRRQLMDAWASYCGGEAIDNVVPLRALG